jgi:steroid delta-isomerase
MVDLLPVPEFEITVEAVVEPRFIDLMGHMNVAWYAHFFDKAVWAFFVKHGLDEPYFARERRGMFALEQSARYFSELREGDSLAIHSGALEVRDKTLRLGHTMTNASSGSVAAYAEVVAAHIDIDVRRTTPFPADLAARLRASVVTAMPGGALTEASAQRFALDWIDAWNRHDVDAVLAHYADDAVFVSPKAERITGSGIVHGKAALEAYWRAALATVGRLEFALDAASWSSRSETLTVLYRSTVDGRPPVRATEIMRFRGGRIVRGEALYGATAQGAP